MKSNYIGLLALCFLAPLTDGIAEIQKGAVVLDVKRLSTSKSTDTRWQTCAGYSNKDHYRSIEVEIKMNNMLRDDLPLKVEWYFISRSLTDGHQNIFDSGSKDIVCKAGTQEVFSVESAELKSTVVTWGTCGYGGVRKDKSGAKIDGYIVRVLYGSNVLDVAASSKPLEKRGYRDTVSVFGK